MNNKGTYIHGTILMKKQYSLKKSQKHHRHESIVFSFVFECFLFLNKLTFCAL